MLTALKRLVLRDKRAGIVKWARWGIAHESQIHYTMSGARSGWLKTKAALPLSTDCSGKFTFNYFMAGAPDPNGLDFKQLGYTGTLMGHGRRISRAEVLPGDAVIWGAYPGVHVCTALDKGARTLESHGQESGPSAISFDAENAYHSARGHQASFWRFPTTVKEQAAHVPAGHPAPKPKPKPAPKPKPKPPVLPTLKKGARGPNVKKLQRLLVKHGAKVSVDGVFGQRTLASVKAFQRRRKLPATGVVNAKTWAALSKKG